MIIPKQFEGLEDLEAMLLTSILGTLVALKEKIISVQQAENYWISDFSVDLFREMKLSAEVVDLVEQAIKLKELMNFSDAYNETIDELIAKIKQQISCYYTEYDDGHFSVSSNILN